MTKAVFILQPYPHPSRGRAIEGIRSAPDGSKVTIGPDVRTKEQNAHYKDRGDILSWHFYPVKVRELVERIA